LTQIKDKDNSNMSSLFDTNIMAFFKSELKLKKEDRVSTGAGREIY